MTWRSEGQALKEFRAFRIWRRDCGAPNGHLVEIEEAA